MRLRIVIKLFGLILMIISLSCQGVPSEVKKVLKLAGANKDELKKVIDHYQKPKDSLKLKSAYFLIKNMTYKYSLEGAQLNKFNTIFSELEKVKFDRPLKKDAITGKFKVVDSIWKMVSKREGSLNRSNLEVKPDLYFIKAAYLIENIEDAFKAWELPWSQHLNFKEFCEYILPYRFIDESLIPWRGLINKKYGYLIDSLKTVKINDPVKVCEIFNKKISYNWAYSHVLTEYPVAMTVDNLMKAKMGSCTQQTGFAIFAMRALGIPVVHEQVPHYGNRSLGHDFNAVLGKDKKFVSFEVGVKQMGEVVETRFGWDYLIPKIYRRTYAEISNSLAAKKSGEEIPFYFRNSNLVDVTAQYLAVSDVEINLVNPASENNQFVYLCVFDNQNWKAVAWSQITNHTAVFKNMGQGFIYMPMYYKNSQLVPASHSIQLDKFGKVTSLIPVLKQQNLKLKRKYKPKKWLNGLTLGGKFQASNKSDFSNAVDLYQIKDTLRLISKDIPIKSDKKYRYVRYVIPPNSKGDMAEISFYSGTNKKIKGKIITSKNIRNENSIKNVFDEKTLTFVRIEEKKDAAWLGLDFGEKKKITQFSFCPRTDKNNVLKGLNYELFYWKNGWKSLGVNKVKIHDLDYESPISNTVYLLRCLDEGKEERIFTYEKDKQIWW